MNKIIKEDISEILASDLIDWSDFKNKAILITGASGMLPSYMAYTLLELNNKLKYNIKIFLLVRNKKKAISLFEDYLDDENLEFIIGDVCDPFKIDEKLDYIIHAASQASPKYYGIDPVGTARANIIGTDNLLRMAVEHNVTGFFYFSTGGVYGNLESEDIIIREEMTGKVDPLNVRSCYFESKRMGENLCVDYHYQYNVPVKIVRIFHTLGPTLDITDGRAFSDFCKCVIEGNDIVLRSDGSARRTFLYVTDATIAFFLILLKGEKGTAYNVGSEKEETSMKNLAECLVNEFAEKRISLTFNIDKNSVTYGRMKNPVDRAIPDLSKLKALGWSENKSFLESFRRTIQSKMLNQH